MGATKSILKDKKIEIIKSETVYDPGKGNTTTWVKIHQGKLWAYYRQLSGKERYANSTANYVEEIIFVINWRSDVKPGFKVLYKGYEHEIIRVDDFEGYKENLKIYTTNQRMKK